MAVSAPAWPAQPALTLRGILSGFPLVQTLYSRTFQCLSKTCSITCKKLQFCATEGRVTDSGPRMLPLFDITKDKLCFSRYFQGDMDFIQQLLIISCPCVTGNNKWINFKSLCLTWRRWLWIQKLKPFKLIFQLSRPLKRPNTTAQMWLWWTQMFFTGLISIKKAKSENGNVF